MIENFIDKMTIKNKLVQCPFCLVSQSVPTGKMRVHCYRCYKVFKINKNKNFVKISDIKINQEPIRTTKEDVRRFLTQKK